MIHSVPTGIDDFFVEPCGTNDGNASNNARIAGGSQHSTGKSGLTHKDLRITAQRRSFASREPPLLLNDDRHVHVAFLAQYLNGYILIVAAKTEIEDGISYSHILDLQPVQIVGQQGTIDKQLRLLPMECQSQQCL